MGNRQSHVGSKQKKRVVPIHEPGNKKQNFLCNLFAKTRFDAAALAATCPPPVGYLNFGIFCFIESSPRKHTSPHLKEYSNPLF